MFVVFEGIDGSGKTQIGLNLYPRVPDLRLLETQNLTDGEIHYIIENGVQLTGMPAWGNPHRQPGTNSWKLALYIRNLRPLTSQEKTQRASTIARSPLVKTALYGKDANWCVLSCHWQRQECCGFTNSR